MLSELKLELIVESGDAGERLDRFVASRLTGISREQIKRWIASGEILLDGRVRRPSDRIALGQALRVDIAPIEPVPSDQAQPVELTVVYEDDELLVVDKPAGLVVHPGNGQPDLTLMNGLLHRYPASSTLPRAGIVHRLDKETSGLLVVARTMAGYWDLVTQLKDRSVRRIYHALVWGRVTQAGRVDAPIGRHRVDRTKMAVVSNGKPAVTHYRPLEVYESPDAGSITRVECRLETGRTHQIRVHLASIGFPIVGDPVYGRKRALALDGLEAIDRQALHATELTLSHPATKAAMLWRSDLPRDMQDLIVKLESR